MKLPKIHEFQRAWEIMKNPPCVSQVSDFEVLKQDVRIAKIAQEILPFVTFLAGVGLVYSLFVGSVIGSVSCGVVLIISWIANYRFSQFEYHVEKDLDAIEFGLVALDWKNTVPDPDKTPIVVDEKSTFETNYLNIKIIAAIPSKRFRPHNAAKRKIIDKCWAFALKQEGAEFLKSCYLCHAFFNKFGERSETRIVKVVCDDGELRLPQFLTYFIKNDRELNKNVDGEIRIKGMLRKELLYRVIIEKDPEFLSGIVHKISDHPGVDPFNQWRIIPCFDPSLKGESDVQEKIDLLQTLDAVHDLPLRTLIQSSLIIPKVDADLIEKLKRAKVTEVTLGFNVKNEDLKGLKDVPLQTVHSPYHRLTDVGLNHLKALPIRILFLFKPNNEDIKLLSHCETIEELTLWEPNCDLDGIVRLEKLPKLWKLTVTKTEAHVSWLDSFENMPALEHLTIVTPTDQAPADGSLSDKARFEKLKEKNLLLKITYI